MSVEANWEEIKKLAADFQRAQLSSTAQKLAERNCHEIVQKLFDLHLIEVIHTTDGKSYLTPQELEKEILEELSALGGRVNVVSLQQAINVDLIHIQAKVEQLVSETSGLFLITNQVIAKEYLDTLAETINDDLQYKGEVKFAELSKQFDLPGEFLLEQISDRLGRFIFGKLDSSDKDVIYTESFMNRQKAKVKGILSAVSKPTALSLILAKHKLSSKLLGNLIQELVNLKRLSGILTGNRSVYVPEIYSSAQSTWVQTSFKQNGYLDYETIKRLGVTDPVSFIKSKLVGEQIFFLKSCCTGMTFVDQIEASVDEALSQHSWIDISADMPAGSNENDANALLSHILKRKSGVVELGPSVVASQHFINACSKPFEDMMGDIAEKNIVDITAYFTKAGGDEAPSKKAAAMEGKDVRKEERRKKAVGGSKAGGGLQGREGKTKAVKNKYKGHGGRDVDTGDSHETSKHGLVFMDSEDIQAKLLDMNHTGDCTPEVVEAIVDLIHASLQGKYETVARQLFLKSSGALDSGASKRRKQANMEEKINQLFTNIKLFQKSFSVVPEALAVVLEKHLLQTLCSDLANALVALACSLNGVIVEEFESWNADSRGAALVNVSDKLKATFKKLHLSSSKSVESFIDYVHVCTDANNLNVLLKKTDRKKERQLVFNHKQALLEQMTGEVDLAMTLHLAVTVAFQNVFQTMLSCPGKAIPQIIQLLSTNLDHDAYKLLLQGQELVRLQRACSEDKKNEVNHSVEAMLPELKNLAATVRKRTNSQAED